MGPKSCDRPSTCIRMLRRSVPGSGNTEAFARSRVSELPGCGSGRSVYKTEKKSGSVNQTRASKRHTPEEYLDGDWCPRVPGQCRAMPP